MARIRTIKPEAFTSESLAEVRVEAERTFFGLLTQADDRGRHRDNAAVIAGALWPLRPDHTAVQVEEDLRQLAAARLVCRYTGCDGKRYLHFPTWDDHQKINKPSESRQPVCREHDPEARCGHCKKTECPSRKTFPESSRNPPGAFGEGSNPSETDTAGTDGGVEKGTQPALTASTTASQEAPEPGTEGWGEGAGHSVADADSGSPPGTLPELSSAPHVLDLGPRNMDLGSSAYGGADSAAHDGPPSIGAQQLVGEWLKRTAKRPPNSVIGQTAKQIKTLLDDGINPDDIRRGLARWMTKGLHPNVLPSVVNEVMNAAPAALPSNVITLPTGQTLAGTDARVASHYALIAQMEAEERSS